jgi:hypothetical protein
MKPAPETISREPPEPYIIDGQRFYNVRQAAQIVGAICEATCWRWADKGVTSFGYHLDVKRLPVTHHRRSTQTPRTFLDSRMLIPEAQVLAMKQILEAAGKTQPGPWSRGELATLEAVARRRNRLLALSHPSRPPAPV